VFLFQKLPKEPAANFVPKLAAAKALAPLSEKGVLRS